MQELNKLSKEELNDLRNKIEKEYVELLKAAEKIAFDLKDKREIILKVDDLLKNG